MPRAADIAPHLKDAALLAICTPQNPTGTTLSKEELEKSATWCWKKAPWPRRKNYTCSSTRCIGHSRMAISSIITR